MTKYPCPCPDNFLLKHDENGKLLACLFIAPEPQQLPARDWLGRLFTLDQLTHVQRLALLAGQQADGLDHGNMICSCHGVGQNEICNAIKNGATDTDSIGQQLRAGTNCGACLPEIRALLKNAKPTLPHAVGE